MKLANTIVTGFLLILALSACHRGMICPAFQSSFIMDDSVRTAVFSPFGGDSLPKAFIVDKSKYGVINKLSYTEKNNAIKNIEMQLVFPPGLPLGDSTALLAPPPPADSLEHQMTNQK